MCKKIILLTLMNINTINASVNNKLLNLTLGNEVLMYVEYRIICAERSYTFRLCI